MSLPSNVSMAYVIGQYANTDGTPCSGTVTFTPQPTYWRNPAANVMIMGTPQVQHLDANGTFEAALIATDDPDLIPGDWFYTCRINLTDCHRAWSFRMTAPATTGSIWLESPPGSRLYIVAPPLVENPPGTVFRELVPVQVEDPPDSNFYTIPERP